MDYIESLDLWKNNRKFQSIHWDEVRVGMDVYIDFVPYSQKYIDDLFPIWGKVVEVGDVFDEIKVEKDGEAVELARPGVHFFGMGRGYDYTIYMAV